MRAALLLANDMAKNNFVSTRGSDGSTPTMRYNSQNSRTTKSAEMVAAGQTTVDVVVATWIKSAGAYLYSDLSSSASTTRPICQLRGELIFILQLPAAAISEHSSRE
ncbi:hypothetical protein PC110_g15331 [Phytophthora cactorum]|uniref:Uncharacterized protein n=1 Tax=Phytophthora cactorum TaxID=29920 RepID=A0A329RUU2_9STRA|nr:hypothetical protein PC110_g15331 [Phytophthora cactorum]